METKWILIPLLMIIGLGLFYFVNRDDYNRNPIEFIRTILKESLRIVAAFFLGSFGFSIASFDQENE